MPLTLYFYSADVLVTKRSTNHSIKLFKQGRLSLAYQRAERSCTLTATDSQFTPVYLLTHGRFLTTRPAAYGHMCFHPDVVPGFKGEDLDPWTRSYFLGQGYRQYHSGLMRFASSDHQSPFDQGGLNAYAFTSGDPVNYSDPTGHAPVDLKRPVSVLGTTHRGKGGKFDGIRYFVSEPTESGPSTLYVVGHGEPGSIIGNTKKYSPKELITELKRNRLDVTGGPSHIMACYSAAPPWIGARSFIDEFAALTGKVSRGYKKPVSVVSYSFENQQIAVVLKAPPLFKNILNITSTASVAHPLPPQAQHIRSPHT